jgi:hypothetical protein
LAHPKPPGSRVLSGSLLGYVKRRLAKKPDKEKHTSGAKRDAEKGANCGRIPRKARPSKIMSLFAARNAARFKAGCNTEFCCRPLLLAAK